MAHLRSLIIGVLACMPLIAGATYQSGEPPEGFRRVPPGYKARPVDSVKFPNVFMPQGPTYNIGGRALEVPARIKYAEAAKKMVALGLFASPQFRLLASLASWLSLTEMVYDATKGIWQMPDEDAEPSDGFKYSVGNTSTGWHPSRQTACDTWFAANSGGSPWYKFENPRVEGERCVFDQVNRQNPNEILEGSNPIYKGGSDCEAGKYFVDGECVSDVPYREISDPEEFSEELLKKTMPPGVPKDWPDPLPTEGLPEVDPFSVPTTEPQPNPDFDPELPTSQSNPEFYQPTITVTHSPTLNDPWRVVLKPTKTASETGETLPDVIPDENIDPETGDKKDPEKGGDPTKPNYLPPNTIPRDNASGDTIGLCDQYPDILACAKLQMPEAEKLQEVEQPFNLEIEEGFEGGGTCPSPIVVELNGRTYEFSWQPFCDSLVMARTFLLALAWLSAAFIILGQGRAEA